MMKTKNDGDKKMMETKMLKTKNVEDKKKW